MQDLGICLGPTYVKIVHKAKDRLIDEEDVLEQDSWLMGSLIKTSEERSSWVRRAVHPLKMNFIMLSGSQEFSQQIHSFIQGKRKVSIQ